MTDQSARFVSAGTRRLQVTRNGRSILRSAGVPKPVVLVDTREKQPLPLFANHPNWIAILIEATFEDIKGGFEPFDIPSGVHPNAVVGTLDAIEAKFGIPILYTSAVRRLATERAASWLSKHFTYWWLEKNGHGRVLIDSDEL